VGKKEHYTYQIQLLMQNRVQHMSIHFTKMHGLGNDFMVIDGVNQTIKLTAAQISALSNRKTGIGFDQCLLVERSHKPNIDFHYRIFNANGTEVGQCGNGARCIARFVYHYGLSKKKIINVSTQTTNLQLILNTDNTVTVRFDHPNLTPSTIPLHATKQSPYYSIQLSDSEHYQVHALSVGNPHAILVVPDINIIDVAIVGKKISEHPFFPEQTNVEFMQILSKSHIKLRVYERGCGETTACGSGALAAAAIGKLYHQLDANITVSLPGGDLLVNWPTVTDYIFLTGPATFVYEGNVNSP